MTVFGVKAIYLIGSTRSGKAQAGSDIDLVIHVDESSCDRAELEAWLDGWSQCLDELNCAKTGRKSGGLLDLHFVTDDDFTQDATWAAQLKNIDDPPQQLYPNQETT